jgi:D-alanyl-D-alanine carboxypeptidase
MKVLFAATALACLPVAHAQPLTELQSVADSALTESGAPAAGVAWVTRDGGSAASPWQACAVRTRQTK